MSIATNKDQAIINTKTLHNQGFAQWRNEIESTYQHVNYHIRLKNQTIQKTKMIDQIIHSARADIKSLKKQQKCIRSFYLQSQRNEHFIHSNLFSNRHFLGYNPMIQYSYVSEVSDRFHRQMRELDNRIATLERRIDEEQKKDKNARMHLERKVYIWIQQTNVSHSVHSGKCILPYTPHEAYFDHTKMIAKRHFLNKGSDKTSMNEKLRTFLQHCFSFKRSDNN